MIAAWRVTGEPKEEIAKVVDDEKLDYELFDRWIKFLAKPPRFYPVPDQVAGDDEGRRQRGRSEELADEFQALLLDVMFESKELNEENDIIKAKALRARRRRSRRSCRATSSPTTTSAPTAALS